MKVRRESALTMPESRRGESGVRRKHNTIGITLGEVRVRNLGSSRAFRTLVTAISSDRHRYARVPLEVGGRKGRVGFGTIQALCTLSKASREESGVGCGQDVVWNNKREALSKT